MQQHTNCWQFIPAILYPLVYYNNNCNAKKASSSFKISSSNTCNTKAWFSLRRKRKHKQAEPLMWRKRKERNVLIFLMSHQRFRFLMLTTMKTRLKASSNERSTVCAMFVLPTSWLRSWKFNALKFPLLKLERKWKHRYRYWYSKSDLNSLFIVGLRWRSTQPETRKLQQVCCRLVTMLLSRRHQDAFASLAPA